MKSLKLIAKGRVQRVGYRNYIDSIAFEMGVKGYVKNLEDGTVEIIGQHEQDEVLEILAEKAKITEYPISVTAVEKGYIDMPPFDKFEIQRGDPAIEQAERLDEAAFYLMKVYGSNKEISGSSKEILSSNKEILEVSKENLEVSKKGFDRIEKKLESFADATMQRFDTVDNKYGKISDKLDKLDKISDSLERLADVLEAFKPK